MIILQPRAKADLAEIWEFIADDSDAHADAFIDLIDQKFQVLAHQPGIGRRRDELADGLRSFPVGFRSCGFCMGPATLRQPSVSQHRNE